MTTGPLTPFTANSPDISTNAPGDAAVDAPLAAKKPQRRVHHNDVYIDDYEWLREKDNTEVIAHLEAENRYTDFRTAHQGSLRKQIFDEIKERTQETDLSVPVRRGNYWYYTRTVEGQEYGIHCRAPIDGPDDWTVPQLGGATSAGGGLTDEQVVLDDNAEAEGHEFFSLGSFDLSDDGTQLLYAVDIEGDERYTIRVRTIATGQNLPDEISNTSAGALFDPSGRYLFYTTVDDAWRPDTVWRHRIGTQRDADISIFHETDERFWVGVGITRSRKFLMIEAGSSVTTEAWVLEANDPTGEFAVVWPREDNVEYDVDHAVMDGEDRLLIVHNGGSAVNFELVSVAAANPQGKKLMVLPHDTEIRLEGVDAFADFLLVEYRRAGLTRLAIDRHDGSGLTELEFEEPLFAVGAGGNPEWSQPRIRFGFTSFVTPSTIYDLDIASGERHLLKQQPVLGGYDAALYEQRREWATANDGTRVPISLVYRRDLVTLGRPAPTLLYGYGSYEQSIDPGFGIARLSLLDRGMIYAIAHVRGGGELGRTWYENGKTTTKQNTFTDFVSCAHHLIAHGFTTPTQLVAEGGSAGGLLMGAVANLAPELFKGILAEVPFVDALTSMLDPSIPLTVIEWDEWGDPLHDADVYAYMKAYSPIENVHAVAYPAIMAVTSLNDTRVLYVEPAKWVAKLREVGADALLRTEMSAGHGGVSGRYSAWQERAFNYAWILDIAGLNPKD